MSNDKYEYPLELDRRALYVFIALYANEIDEEDLRDNYSTWCDDLHEAGLFGFKDGEYVVTEKGLAYLDAILNVPEPTQIWVVNS